MTMKKVLCLVLALVLCGAMAFAEADLQTQLDEANARIAELEAAVELYKPFYDAQVVAEYDGGVIFLEDALVEYAQYESMYASYGINLADYGLDAQYKQMAVESLVQNAAIDAKAAELGLYDLDDETLAGLSEEAAANFEAYITSISSYFEAEGVSEEEVRTQSIDYLASMGYTQESLLESMVVNYVDEKLYNMTVEGVAVTAEDVQAAYDALVAEQETSFASDSSYNNARNNGDLIVWNPEGYRAVKHVLVKFNDEQAAACSELTTELSSLNAELEAAQTPTGDEAVATTEEIRPVEDIEADIAAVQAEIDALYAELAPRAQEVIDKFNAGTPFADLIAEYNEDPGMQSEPTASNGYAVAATSTTWDPAFTEGAMSIESVGGISAPVHGSYGIHIIYFDFEIPAGAVDFETVKADVEADALETKIADTYAAAVETWVEAINPVYHMENIA